MDAGADLGLLMTSSLSMTTGLLYLTREKVVPPVWSSAMMSRSCHACHDLVTPSSQLPSVKNQPPPTTEEALGNCVKWSPIDKTSPLFLFPMFFPIQVAVPGAGLGWARRGGNLCWLYWPLIVHNSIAAYHKHYYLDI